MDLRAWLIYSVGQLGVKTSNPFANAAYRHKLSYPEFVISTVRSNLVHLGIMLNVENHIDDQYDFIKAIDRIFYEQKDGRIFLLKKFLFNKILYDTHVDFSPNDLIIEILHRAAGLSKSKVRGMLLKDIPPKTIDLFLSSLIGLKVVTNEEQLKRVDSNTKVIPVTKPLLTHALSQRDLSLIMINGIFYLVSSGRLEC